MLKQLIPVKRSGHLMKIAPAVFSRLLAVMHDGVSLLRPAAGLFADFLMAPTQDALDAAQRIVDAFSKSGLALLSPEQRVTLGLQKDASALLVAPELVLALSRTPEIEAATAVSSEVLALRMAQEEELISLGKAVSLGLELVGDARMQLQGWQHEAQRRVLRGLLDEFVNTGSPEERLQIVADAGPALDALEKQLGDLRTTRAQNAGAGAHAESEQAELALELELVQTMRALRDNQPVDPEVLRRVAQRYAARPQAEAPAANPAPDARRPGAKGAAGKKPAGKKPAGKRPGGKSGPGTLLQ